MEQHTFVVETFGQPCDCDFIAELLEAHFEDVRVAEMEDEF